MQRTVYKHNNRKDEKEQTDVNKESNLGKIYRQERKEIFQQQCLRPQRN